jgi:nitric oxide reductase NorE protein
MPDPSALQGRADIEDPHIPGEAGMWVFIFGDMCLFLIYFSNYLVQRFGQVGPFAASQTLLDQNYGAINTMVLLASSLFVVIGLRAVRNHDTVLGSRMFGLAQLCAIAFIALKAGEWSNKVAHGITLATDTFFQYYFILTGLHLFHVVLGLAVLGFIRAQARKPKITAGRMMVVEGGCAWWHMVDLIWMILFPLMYLAH